MSVMTRGHLDERLTRTLSPQTVGPRIHLSFVLLFIHSLPVGFRMLDRDRNGLIHWPDLEYARVTCR